MGDILTQIQDELDMVPPRAHSLHHALLIRSHSS